MPQMSLYSLPGSIRVAAQPVVKAAMEGVNGMVCLNGKIIRRNTFSVNSIIVVIGIRIDMALMFWV